MHILPIDREVSRKVAVAHLETLRHYSNTDQTKETVRLLDAMVAHYQARLVDCPPAEIEPLRNSAKQLALLRTALTTDDPNRVALFI